MALFTLKDFNQTRQYLADGVCTYDRTFEWTDGINTLLANNLWMRDLLVIYDSFTFDLGMYALLYLFSMGVFTSTAPFISLGINSVGKIFVQENLLTMGKPTGFLWYFPGLYSIMVPYWDILDFFYSGHVSTAIVASYGWY